MKSKGFFSFFSLIICSVPVHAMFSNVGKTIARHNPRKMFFVLNKIGNEPNDLFSKKSGQFMQNSLFASGGDKVVKEEINDQNQSGPKRKFLAGGVLALVSAVGYAANKLKNDPEDKTFDWDALLEGNEEEIDPQKSLRLRLKLRWQLFKEAGLWRDKSTPFDYNDTALMSAIKKGRSEQVSYILERVTVEEYNENNVPLLKVIVAAHREACQDLFKLLGSDWRDYSEYGKSTAELAHAFREKHVKSLVERMSNLEAIFVLLLNAKADPALKLSDDKGSTLLRTLLYADNEPPSSSLQRRYTAQNNFIDKKMFDLLFQHVDDNKLYECLEVKYAHESPLAIAFKKRNLYMLQRLHKRVDLSKIKSNWSGLVHNLCKSYRFHENDVELVKIANELGANLFQTQKCGNTLIDVASEPFIDSERECNIPLIEFLALNGVKPHCGWDTFLQRTCSFGFHNRYNRSRKQNDFERIQYNQTAVDLARIAIAHGADVHQKNGSGATLLDIAKKRNNDALVRLLQESGVESNRIIE